jgi:hypothetical protein
MIMLSIEQIYRMQPLIKQTKRGFGATAKPKQAVVVFITK